MSGWTRTRATQPRALQTVMAFTCLSGLAAGCTKAPSDGTGPPREHDAKLADVVGQTGARLDNWPAWRGPLDSGVAPHADPPVEWSETTNIAWKIELPGKGHSTPIVWDDRVFVTAAIPYGDALRPQYSDAPGSHDNAPVTHHQEFVVLAIDRDGGEILWRTTVNQQLPYDQGHVTASLASNSPVTDGERIYAFFGTHGLFCLDWTGNIVWEVQLGRMRSKHGHGEGASPALYGDRIFMNWDHEDQSFVAAFDKHTGEELWRMPRDEPTSWATPIVIQHDGRAQFIVLGTNKTRGYDVDTGAVIWECAGLSDNIVASPVFASGIVYGGNSYVDRAIMAINIDGAAGDITGSEHVLWSRLRGSPYVPSPLLYDDALYFLNHYQNVLWRVHGPSGEDRPGGMRLANLRNIYASPVGAAGRVYVTDLDGMTMVLSHEDTPQLLAENQLDDAISASAAIAGSDLFLRGERYLYCIRESLDPMEPNNEDDSPQR